MLDQHVDTDPEAIPAEIGGWNWGAFLLNWIWGIGNNTFIALLTFIPIIGVVVPFVLGAKGNHWAWRNGRWDSVAHFRRVQRLWAIWGVIIWLGVIALIGSTFGGTFYLLGHSEAYELAESRLQASAQAADALGTPIATGYPNGSIATTGATGRATLSFSATGPKATGRIFLEAIKKDGVWSLTRLTLRVEGRNEVIDLIDQNKVENPEKVDIAGRSRG